MAEGIYPVTCSEWKLVQRRLNDLENIVSNLKLKLENCKCNPSTDLEIGHSDDETETVIGINTQSNLISAASGIIDISGQSTTQAEEILTLAVTVGEKSNVADSTITASTSPSLNDSSSTEIPVTTNSTLHFSNGMAILEIEKYRRAEIKLTRCDVVEVTRTPSSSKCGNANDNSTSAKHGLHILSKKRPINRRKENDLRGEFTSAPHLPGKERFVCHFCSKRFAGNRDLTRHVRVHSRDKPFQCDTCSQTFSQEINLIRHTRIHTGDKPFECGFCSKKFSTNFGLEAHLRSHTGERPFTCHFCSKKFCQSSSLVVHLRSHTGERPYVCQMCSKTFASRCNMQVHLKVHTREKPYSCPFCTEVFAYGTSLKRHLSKHPSENSQSQSEIQHETVPGPQPS